MAEVWKSEYNFSPSACEHRSRVDNISNTCSINNHKEPLRLHVGHTSERGKNCSYSKMTEVILLRYIGGCKHSRVKSAAVQLRLYKPPTLRRGE